MLCALLIRLSVYRPADISKELTKLVAQLNKLMVELVSLVGWILIILNLLDR